MMSIIEFWVIPFECAMKTNCLFYEALLHIADNQLFTSFIRSKELTFNIHLCGVFSCQCYRGYTM